MPCQHGIVGHDHPISDFAIVRDMAIGHDQAIVADAYDRIFLAGRIDRHKFPDLAIFTDDDIGFFPAKLEILRFRPDTCGRPHNRPFANGGISIDISMRFNHNIDLPTQRCL